MSTPPYHQIMNGDGTASTATVLDARGNYAAVTDPAVQTWLKTNTIGAPPIAQARAARIDFLRAACQAQIVAGYQSSALGAVYTYPSQPTDQLNMLASAAASLLPGVTATWTTPFWCADATGKWAMVDHTAAQIQQAAADGKNAIVTAQQKLAALTARTNTSNTLTAIMAVTW